MIGSPSSPQGGGHPAVSSAGIFGTRDGVICVAIFEN